MKNAERGDRLIVKGVALVHVLILLYMTSHAAQAQMAVPLLRDVKPWNTPAGQMTTIEILGKNLEGASEIQFENLGATVESFEPSKDRIKAKIRIPRGIAPGPRALRVVTPNGLSNAVTMVVGRPIPSLLEIEPNNGYRKAQSVAAPCTVEGEIRNGNEVDVFAVEMKAGTTLVADCVAARAGSGLDALVTIFSPEGREIASDDDSFGQDAATWAFIEHDGRYYVQIQDANGANPDNAAEGLTTRPYLLAIGDVPLVISAFPAGGKRDTLTPMSLLGINLPEGRAFGFRPPETSVVGDFLLRVETPKGEANALIVRVSDHEEFTEADAEPADDPLRPAMVRVPGTINGRFAARDDGDIDYYHLIPTFESDYAISVYAAKVGSSADPVVAVVDLQGATQAEDDDALGRDARILRRIGADGLTIAVRDAFGRGGPRAIYRIEVEPTQARRVDVTAHLGGRTVPRDGSIAVPITVARQGMEGPVTVLSGELPEGVTAAPVTIPANANEGMLVFSAADSSPLGPFPLRIVVRDIPGGASVAYREHGKRQGPPRKGSDGKPQAAEGEVDVASPRMAVGVRASLGVTIAAAGESEIKVTLDRRSPDAKKPVTLRLVASSKDLEGFEPVPEAQLSAETSDHVFRLKAKPGAILGRIPFTVKAWYAGSDAEREGVDARPTVIELK